MPTDRSPRPIWLSFALAGVVCAVGGAVYVAGFGSPVFPMDDAYITLHNAQVLLDGNDPNYGVPFLVGATSPVHVYLLALLGTVIPLLWASWVLNLAAVCVIVAGVIHLGRGHGLPWWMTAAAVVVSVTSGLVVHQVMNGLETGLAMAAATWALVLLGHDGRPRWPLGVLLGLLPFLRPELAVFTALASALCAWRIFRAGDRIGPEMLRFGLFVAAGAAPFLLSNLLVTGSAIPATMGAKTAFFAELSLPLDVKVKFSTAALRKFLIAVGPVALALIMPVRARGRLALAFFVVFLAAYFTRFPGALGHNDNRYLYLFVPFMMVGLLDGLAAARKPLRQGFLVLLVLAFGYGLWQFPGALAEHRNIRNFTTLELKTAADWCNANLAPGTRILVHDAGYIAFNTDFPLSDMVGLKSPEAIAFHKHFSQPSGGNKRWRAIFQFAELRDPQYVIVLGAWDDIFRITKALRRGRWDLVPVFEGRYTIYRIFKPGEKRAGPDRPS